MEEEVIEVAEEVSDESEEVIETGEEEGVEETFPEADEERSDTFQTIMAIMIAVVSLTGAVIAWQATLAEPDDADREGLQATLNAEIVRFINSAVLYKNYRAYTDYTLNDELQRQIAADLDQASPEEEAVLKLQQSQALDNVGINRLFFPQRYLNRDGSYNSERQLSEAWAQASQEVDLDAEAHFDAADAERNKISLLIGVIIVLTISLVFYTLAEGLHPVRRGLRVITAVGGTIFLVGGIAGAIVIEIML